jgi:hypothetical protein
MVVGYLKGGVYKHANTATTHRAWGHMFCMGVWSWFTQDVHTCTQVHWDARTYSCWNINSYARVQQSLMDIGLLRY